ncbi:MAG: response regulator [Lachnospiraceae bacterium]|nr:response regulator [Lachnospiraceae bacterium]
MAYAIYNGYNHKENCIYFERTMVRELEIENAVAVEANKAKSSFLANMSHEIPTPINAVLGMNEMILRECEDESIVAYSESIKSAGHTLLGLVNNILDFSKIEAGKMEINPVDYDLSSVINDLVNMVYTRAEDKGLTLALNIDQGIPKCLHGDEIRVKQVITNILTNAVKYTEKGTVTFNLSFAKESDDEIMLKVMVEDTGIGIKKEDIHKLFEKFDRIEETRNRNIEGTGLGMNITQKLLEMMGADLQVSSTYGVGSSFAFDLKQKVTKWEELGDYESSYRELVANREIYREKFTAPDAHVLVIDDNPMNLVVFKSLLKQTRVKVDIANDGDEGLKMTHDRKYDVIFFDHMMPGKDGIETLHEMRGEGRNPNANTLSVCLTANAVSGAREEYLAAGFDDYLTKPVDPEKLEEMLVSMLPKEKIIRVKAKNPAKLKNILLFTYQNSVIVKGIEKKLADSYEISMIVGDPAEVANKASENGLVIIYLPSEIVMDITKRDALEAMIKASKENMTGVILVGEADSKDALIEKLPSAGECQWVNRPVDIVRLTEAVKSEMESESE